MRNTELDKMHLSSPDEAKGQQFINRAITLVKEAILEDVLQENGLPMLEQDLPDIYVVWFSKTLHHWKAMISTSEANGHYYEVTHNGIAGETYLDRYSKDYNEVIKDPVY